MTPETSNAQSYELTEGRITRVNTEQAYAHSNGGSLEDWILRNKIPELRDMQTAYWEFARKLNRLAGGSELATDFWPEGESVEDFIAAATEGRYEEEEDEPDS